LRNKASGSSPDMGPSSVSAGQNMCGAPRRNRTGDPILTMDRRTSAVLSGIFAGHSVPQRPQLWGQLASIPGSSALTHPLQGHSIDDPGRDHPANRLVHEQHRQQHREEPPTPLRHGKHSVRYVSGSCPFGTQPTRTRSLLHGAVPPTDRLACVRRVLVRRCGRPRAVTARCRSLELSTFPGVENVALAPS
jgi:hypothetical protein